MRDIGRSGVLAGLTGLCAVGACTTVPRPSVESRPIALTEECTLVEPPRPDEATHTARIAFVASGLTRDVCALRLVSLALRPRFASSQDHWTVEVVLDDSGATARPLRREEARDLLDTARTLVATEDLTLVAYVAARPGLAVLPLPWDRTYVYITQAASGPLGKESFSDAVRVDARPAESTFCDTSFSPQPITTEKPSPVVYEIGDRTARDLAERVVALGGGSAVPLERAEFEMALRTGKEHAYILSVPRTMNEPCEVQQALLDRGPWATTAPMIPLIDTRAYAIAPRDSAP
jgi:hypothetical protein